MKRLLLENNKRIVYFILVIAWMIIVFSFSNQNGEESQNMSDTITDKIIQTICSSIDKDERQGTKDFVSFVVRKLAHFTIYFIGGILIFGLINTFSIKMKYIVILTVMFGFLYAVSDEIHQFFVSDRSARAMDVLIDTSGVGVAVICRYLVFKIVGGKNGRIRPKRVDERIVE